MLQHSAPDDYVLATNETHSVREFLDLTFKIAKIENGIERFVKTDETLMRPSEVDLLIGDYSKAKKVLSWQPQVSFPDLVEKMYSHDFDLLKRGDRLR
jgi:GDPmannose 4,6-dehydratase